MTTIFTNNKMSGPNYSKPASPKVPSVAKAAPGLADFTVPEMVPFSPTFFGSERLFESSSIKLELGEECPLEKPVIEKALLASLNNNSDLLSFLEGFSDLQACSLRFRRSSLGGFLSGSANIFNGVFDISLSASGIQFSEEEIEASLSQSLRNVLLSERKAGITLAQKIIQRGKLDVDLVKEIKSNKRSIRESPSPFWDECLLYINERWARLLLAEREALHGVSVSKYTDELDRFAEVFEKDSIDLFYMFVEGASLFRPGSLRGNVFAAAKTLPDLPRAGGKGKVFDIYVHGAAVGQLDGSITRNNLFKIYQKFYEISLALGETRIAAAQKAIQFFDRFLYGVDQKLMDSSKRKELISRVLYLVAKSPPQDPFSSYKSLLNTIQKDYLLSQIYLLLSKDRMVGGWDIDDQLSMSELTEVLPLSVWIDLIASMQTNYLYKTDMSQLLKQFAFSKLLRIYNGLLQINSNNAAVSVFNTILALNNGEQRRQDCIRTIVNNFPKEFLAKWATLASVEQLELLFLFEGGVFAGRGESKLIKKMAAAIMHYQGPEAFVKWRKRARKVLSDLAGISYSSALDASNYLRERHTYLYTANYAEVQELSSLIVRLVNKREEDGLDQAMALLSQQDQQTQLHIIRDLFNPNIPSRPAITVTANLSSDQIESFLALNWEPRILSGFLNALLDSDISSNVISKAVLLMEEDLCFSLLFYNPGNPLRIEKNNESTKLAAVRKHVIKENGFSWFIERYSKDFDRCVRAEVLRTHGILSIDGKKGLGGFSGEVLASFIFGFSDREMVELLDDKQAGELAAYLIDNDIARVGEVFGIDFSENKKMERLSRLFPSVRKFLLLSYISLLEGMDVTSPYPVFAAQRIREIDCQGVPGKLLDRARRLILRWFTLYYAENMQALENSKLAKRLEPFDPGVLYRAGAVNGVVKNDVARVFYFALRKLGAIIQPYRAARIELEMENNFPSYLKIVSKGGVCYEVDLLNGGFRVNHDSFIHDEEAFKSPFTDANQRILDDIDAAFQAALKLQPRALMPSLTVLSVRTGIPLEDILPSTLSAVLSKKS
ncbi:MAG: hypothetical protein HQ564_01380 [Candidatus Saganbacteria bacterium]|nr:hypothetical protein [Candidatus Saganbacteria bacterium]